MQRLALTAILVAAFACGGSQTPESSTAPVPGTSPVEGGASGAAAKACVPSGCSNTVCAEEGSGVVTTCEWKPEYDCYKQATCERQPSGECGWTMTDPLKACLAGGGGSPG